MREGSAVEVYSRFDGSWVRGFALAGEQLDDKGRVTARFVRRVADRVVLPRPFPAREVRPSAQ